MASGTMKRIAARNHRVTLPGPAWAAAGIQRVPTMQVIASRVMSRRPSSRLSSLCMGALRGGLAFGLEFETDAAQALIEELGFGAEPHANVAFEAEVGTGHDQHT